MAVEERFPGYSYDFRHFEREAPDAPDAVWFTSGGGDEYRLLLVGDDALLTVFDHESPQSPWARDDGLGEWPGMFTGLPDHLRARLPPRDDEPLSVSDCYWFTGGQWHHGEPESLPADEYDEPFYAQDPGGARELLEPLLDPCEGVRHIAELYDASPERLPEAIALFESFMAAAPRNERPGR